MASPFLGEVRIFGFNFAPYGWAFCSGQTLPIQQYTALFSLLGTNYGGNGVSTFQLPNFNGIAPINAGTGPGLSPYSPGDTAGVTDVTIDQTTMPAHTHSLNVNNVNADNSSPAKNVPAKGGKGDQHQFTPFFTYVATTSPDKNLAANSITTVGGNLPHTNVQPNLSLTFCIALQGVFPQRP